MKFFALKSIYSSLTVKVFIGFWIIAITATAVTHWISIKFVEINRVEAISAADQNKIDATMRRLDKIITRAKPESIKQLINGKLKLPQVVWLKEKHTNKVESNIKHAIPRVLAHIQEQKFSQPISAYLSGYQLIGPTEFTFKDKQYQIYLGKYMARKNIVAMILQLPLWLRIFIGFLITGLLSWLLSWYLIRPLKKLKQASQSFGQGKLSTRLPEFEDRFDEVGRLGQAFNSMAEQVQNSMSSQQRLLGDISHELRSPLTRLQLALTLIQKLDNTNPALNKYLDRFNTEVTRLDLMINQALQLSRLESQIQQLNIETFNLTTLVNNVVEDARFIGQQKNIDIYANIGSDDELKADIEFTGDKQLIHSAIENVLGNAIRYSPENGKVTCSLTATKKMMTLSISDQGPGVALEQIDDIFKPFYRTSEARDRISGGTGLGLAIASGAIHCHKGQMYAKLASNEKRNPGLTVVINLPI
ncbi:ATP-binding protein [Colwelliaceae bacterium BS250]